MTQLRITKRRTASARRRHEMDQPLPLDLRDPDITRAKQLQRRDRRHGSWSASWASGNVLNHQADQQK